ncbi:MAG: tetratricopeptide repeat protein [Chloroflexi bacterium]|nr:MAG: tetratricopeptide repeat protein [Chloroflexota bacterium]
MQLRTPKRYTKGHKRSIISLRRLWLWILTPLLVYGGLQVYQNRDTLGPPVQDFVADIVADAQSGIATAIAPTPLPTQDPAERIAIANDAWQRGAMQEAVADYASITNLAPNDVLVHYRWTLGLIMNGQLDAALDAAERTVTADPFSSDAWAIRAMALDWNGHAGEAIASAQHALELDPQNPRALAFLAEAYLDAGQPDRALQTVEQALEIDPDSFEAYRVRGLIRQTAQFDFEGAREDYLTAYELAPHISYPAIDLARIEFSLQNIDDAIATLTNVIELNPENAEALFWMSVFQYSGKGDPNQASDFASRCVAANPDSIACNYYLGRIQIGLEQYALAADSLDKAIELGTTNPIHFWWAGQAQLSLGNCPAAVNYLNTGYRIARENEQANLYSDFEDLLRECQAFGGVRPTATPAAEADV